jgi:excisionase family DNA binding protein
MDKKLFSTGEAAKLLGISRIAVFKKIKKGQIKAQKIGSHFFIAKEDLSEVLGSVLAEKNKKEIKKAVDKTISDYGETLRLLGKE